MHWLNQKFVRFLLAGTFNTVNGYIWILGLQAITQKPIFANILGYAISACMGYIAHSRYTFRQRSSWKSIRGYFVVLALSYLLNLAVLSACLRVLPPVPSQIIAITVFAIANYVGQSRFAFGSS